MVLGLLFHENKTVLWTAYRRNTWEAALDHEAPTSGTSHRFTDRVIKQDA